MNINITDEQILAIAEKRINELVDTRVKEVLNSEYWQTMSERIDRAVKEVVTEKVTEGKINRAISNIDMSKIVANMSNSIVEKLIEGMQDY